MITADCNACQHEDKPLCNRCFIPENSRLNKHTNADRIRAMSDEDLADFIARQRFSTINPIADKLGIDVTLQFIEGRKNALDWLKQEVDDET